MRKKSPKGSKWILTSPWAPLPCWTLNWISLSMDIPLCKCYGEKVMEDKEWHQLCRTEPSTRQRASWVSHSKTSRGTGWEFSRSSFVPFFECLDVSVTGEHLQLLRPFQCWGAALRSLSSVKSHLGDRNASSEPHGACWGLQIPSFTISHTGINTHCGHFWVGNLTSEVLHPQVSQRNIAALIDTINKRVRGWWGNLLTNNNIFLHNYSDLIGGGKKISNLRVTMATFPSMKRKNGLSRKIDLQGDLE